MFTGYDDPQVRLDVIILYNLLENVFDLSSDYNRPNFDLYNFAASELHERARSRNWTLCQRSTNSARYRQNSSNRKTSLCTWTWNSHRITELGDT